MSITPEPPLKTCEGRFKHGSILNGNIWLCRVNSQRKSTASGKIAVGDSIVVAKSDQKTTLMRIVTYDGDQTSAREGQAITLVLADDVEVSRGDMLVASTSRPNVADQFKAHIIWFSSDPLIPGRSYILRTETDSISATITSLKFIIDVDDFSHRSAKTLMMNEIGVCNLSTQHAICFDSYTENRSTGNFILIDRFTNATVGAGMIIHSLYRAHNLHLQAFTIDKSARAAQKSQRPVVLWFTGLSGSGKSTIANLVEKLLFSKGKHTFLLDGDNVRHGLNRDLGFTTADRVENIRRVGEVARLMTDAGLIVLVSLISPFRSERQVAREMMSEHEFIEVFVDTPIEECVRRDPKGLYKKAIAGQIPNFTGISSPYEPPENPDIHLRTACRNPLELAQQVEAYLSRFMQI